MYMMDYIDRFSDVEPALQVWDETYLIIMDDFLMYSWIQFASILLRILASMFMSVIGL